MSDRVTMDFNLFRVNVFDQRYYVMFILEHSIYGIRIFLEDFLLSQSSDCRLSTQPRLNPLNHVFEVGVICHNIVVVVVIPSTSHILVWYVSNDLRLRIYSTTVCARFIFSVVGHIQMTNSTPYIVECGFFYVLYTFVVTSMSFGC